VRTRRILLSCLILATLSWSAPAAPQEVVAVAESPAAVKRPTPQPALRFNPFAHTDLGRASSGGYGASAAGDGAWQPVLAGTLAAGRDSLANLGGVILGVGEETHGYRLEEVGPFDAVFVKDGRTLRLLVETVGADPR